MISTEQPGGGRVFAGLRKENTMSGLDLWELILQEMRTLTVLKITLGRTVVSDCARKQILVDGVNSRIYVDFWTLEDRSKEGQESLRQYASSLLAKIPGAL